MIDQTSQFFAILTNVGAAKQANADALGVPWKLTEMGVGDANGTDPIPSASQTSLINEWRRRPLNQLFIDPVNPAVIVAEQVIPADEGGFWIREIGLYDADGDLVAVANCPPSFKPIMSQGSGRTQVVRMNFIVSSTGNITLKIDPSVVLATREYVERRILEELYKLDSKQSVRAATTANIALTGLQTIDGVSLLAGDRVLVKNQAASKDNGIYVVGVAAWQRAPDADSTAEVTSAMILSVEQGATLADTRWQLVTDGAIVLGTTSLTFQNITQGFATINSPAFLGSPTAPTAPLNNNSQLLANTAFVQRALGNHSGIGGLDVSTVLTADAFGKSFIINSANPVNITLPKASTGFNGGTITLVNVSTGTATIILQGTDYVAGIAANQLVLKTLDTITLSTGAGITWYAENGSIPDSLSTAMKRQSNPLDLTAGALMPVGAFGIGKAVVSTETNLNNYTISGIYLVPEAGLVNIPPGWSATRRYNLTVGLAGVGSRLTQTLISGMSGDAVGMAIRVCQENGVWTDWEEVTTSRHGPFKAIQTYKTAGVFTWTVPVGVKKAWVTVIGGGGGGGRSGVSGIGSGGGGGGGFSQRLVDLSTVSSVTVTVGTGGAGAIAEGVAGDTGGTSSFGAFLSATGGVGGLGSSSAGLASGPGGGGGGTGGDFNTSLGVGHVSYGAVGGSGGGPGGRCTQGPYPGNGGMGPGGGGSGALFGYNGGPGAAGNVIIQW
ncbi:phage tail protein [Pseudomonas corrugata]|uniref:phage tail-collar fiber domain-containing protein n=1 Tax=Pseudomonas corrugata TaxID=47879 RepID=UPI0028C50C8C|nr:phage tail protein [Pseudomonas corrugata]MDU9031753.1 phage tail protein [Pseudomonas corrugata]MDU9037277.1 phage tail protein [Pseudomonas corrugata]